MSHLNFPGVDFKKRRFMLWQENSNVKKRGLLRSQCCRMRLFRGISRHCVVHFQVPRRFFAKSFLAVVKDHPKLMVTVPKKYLQKRLRSQRKIENEKKMAFFLQRNMTVGSSSSVLIVLSLQFSTKRELKRESYTSGTTALRIQLNCCLMHN